MWTWKVLNSKMLLVLPILAFVTGLLCENLTEVEGFGPEGPVTDYKDSSPAAVVPVEIHVRYESGYQGLYPPESYGLGYQFPSYYPGLFAKYQR